ncbi:MAG: tRNA 2-selenouridine(34) synthase MnmH [Bacteroidota bacterium]
MQRVSIEKYLSADAKTPVIDVRSPAEFTKGHIPGAINIPLFSDLERAKVGTVYKQKSKEEAISLGLEIVGPKMKTMAELAKEYALNKQLKLYCWRGGMRSEKMAWLFELVGLKTTVLEGGYKAYRNYLHNKFDSIEQLIVLQGPTGSAKTYILQALSELGEQIIDLEGLANHKGSVFGGLGEPEQPTTEQFQNNIVELLDSFDLTKTIWVESESMTIGRVYLPEELWHKMNNSTVVSIDVPREFRIRHIIAQYGQFKSEQLISRIEKLQQRLGGKAMSEIIEYVQKEDLYHAVDMLLDYYDNSYAHSSKKYKTKKPIVVYLDSDKADINAQKLVECVLENQYDKI